MARRKIKNPLILVARATFTGGEEADVFPNLPLALAAAAGAANDWEKHGGIHSGDNAPGLQAEPAAGAPNIAPWVDARGDVYEVARQAEATTALSRGYRDEEGVESTCGITLGLRPRRGLNRGIYPVLRAEIDGVPDDTSAGKIFVAIQHEAESNGIPDADDGNPIFLAKLSVSSLPGGGRVNSLAEWTVTYNSSGEFRTRDWLAGATVGDISSIGGMNRYGLPKYK